jgi:hypothetical protein
MWEGILIIGFLLLCVTGLLYKSAVMILQRGGFSLWNHHQDKSFMEIVVEFSTSVILSLIASAALGFLFVGLMGFFGVPIDVP